MAERKRNDDFTVMTREGFDKLTLELKQLRSDERYKIAQRIEEARSFGDLSENAEYAAAKEDQAKLEGKIQLLEYQLSRAKVVDSSSLDASHVAIGTTVTIKDYSKNKEFTYAIVGSEESDPKTGKISSSSPVGQALMGKKEGDEVHVKVPTGIRRIKIKTIEVI